MSRFFHAPALHLLLGLSALIGATPVETQDIQIPSPPVVPAPPVVPGAKISLAGPQWFVVNSKVECSVRGYPAGLVGIAHKKGPRDISAVFVDGNGTVEDRSYDGPFLYIVRATGKGDCTLVITPIGLKKDSDIITAVLTVDSQLPQPPPIPPGPTPGPTPTPTPPDPVVIDRPGMFIVVIEETEQAAQARGLLLGDPTLAAYMKSRRHQWRVVDQNVLGPDKINPPADVKRFLDQAKGQPLPQLYLVDSKGFQIGAGQACPMTSTGMIAAIKKVGG